MPPVSTFTAFDWFLVVLVTISVITGFRRGIVKVLFSFGGLIAGVLLACWNYQSLSLRLHPWLVDPVQSELAAFGLIVVAVVVAFMLLAGMARRAVSIVGLGFVDRLLGGVFGLLRGIVMGVVTLMSIAAFTPRTPWVENSQLVPYFLAGAHAVSFVLPADLEQRIATGAEHLLQQTPQMLRPHTLGQQNP